MGRPPLFGTAMTATEYQRRWRAKRKKLAARKRLLSPASNPPKHDLVMTPPVLAARIVQYFKPTGRVLDPCRGQGAFYNALAKMPGVTAEWCELAEGRDFFEQEGHFDWIISNPPWSKFRRFLNHAMAIADNIVFLATLTHFVTRARLRDIAGAGFGMRQALLFNNPPRPWPGGGFQLVAMHLQRGYQGD
jgi:hypothetical protein